MSMPTPIQKSDAVSLFLATVDILARIVNRKTKPAEPFIYSADKLKAWIELEPKTSSNPSPSPSSSPMLNPAPRANQQQPRACNEAPSETRVARLWSEVNYTPLQPKQSSVVPSSRLGRLGRYLGLAGSLGSGALVELGRRAMGRNQEQNDNSTTSGSSSLFLTKDNVTRLVETLSRMRGAALKLGQMLSIQEYQQSRGDGDHSTASEIERIFERVRNSAHTMPPSQTHSVLEREWGPEWQSTYFQSFDAAQPMAAASIGQVHAATLCSGAKVAVKIQYPGVAQSVDSDLAYLRSLLAFSNLLPKGLYLDNTIRVAQAELAWEVDYVREAHYTQLFYDLLKDYRHPTTLAKMSLCGFAVPKLYPAPLSTRHILVTEWMSGFPIHLLAKATDARVRDRVGTSILYLCLLELFKLGVMQTDPNWTNFLYEPEQDRIVLLDFGSSREFDKHFISKYQKLVVASAAQDIEACMTWSIELGFLTGDESPVMKKAHLDALLALGEPFRKTSTLSAQHESESESENETGLDLYDFSKHMTISNRVKESLPTIAAERLRPPPDDSYSLHRKLSGAYLLCAKLKAKVPCRALLEHVIGTRIPVAPAP